MDNSTDKSKSLATGYGKANIYMKGVLRSHPLQGQLIQDRYLHQDRDSNIGMARLQLQHQVYYKVQPVQVPRSTDPT